MAVVYQGVSVHHRDIAAVTDVDLRIEPGERVALLGPSGAGKTTLLDLAAGLVEPSAGRVEVLGRDLATLRGRRLRAHRGDVGLVGQHLDMALSLRVVHNVNAGRLGRWSTSAALVSLVRAAGTGDAVAALERVGLGDRLWSRTDELSGGERQRVAVARVLRQSPALVLADEPTSSVDPRLADDVMGILCGPAAAAPWTVLVAVHDPALARRHATRLVGVRHGRIVFDGTPATVPDEAVAALYESEP